MFRVPAGKYCYVDSCVHHIFKSFMHYSHTSHTKFHNQMDRSINKIQPEIAECSLDHVEEEDDDHPQDETALVEHIAIMDAFPQTTEESLTTVDVHDCDLSSPAAPSFSSLSSGNQSEASLFGCEEAFSHESATTQHDAESDTPAECTWHGFKIIGDNIDKNIRPRHQTLDSNTNYFQAYAVKDRVNCSSLSDVTPDINLTAIDVKSLLLNQDHLKELKSNFTVLIARILVAHVPAFERYASVVPPHILHQFSDEMKERSEVVSLLNVHEHENYIK